MTMNIAFLNRRYDNIGGTERDLYELAGWFLRFGHQVHLYCGEFRVSPQDGAVPHRVPFLRLGETAKFLSFAFFAPRAALAGGHDAVVSFGRVLGQDIVRCGGGTHRGFLDAIAEVRGAAANVIRWPKDRVVLAVEKRQFARGNHRRIIAISEVVKRELIDIYDVPADDIEVIYDGIDISMFRPENKGLYRAELRESLGIGAEEKVALFVGSGFLRKGLEFALDALALSRDRPVRLVVVGDDPNPARYRSLGGQLDTPAVFVGPRKDVERFYGAADFLVLPSVQEAFGNVILEALACGLPVITTRKAGASEVLEGALREYILARHDDTREMSKMMDRLVDDGLRAELSALARQTAEKYTIEANARAIERLCERVVTEKSEGSLAAI